MCALNANDNHQDLIIDSTLTRRAYFKDLWRYRELFYFLAWLALRKVPLKYRFILAVILEAGWEILENSPLIINRYRSATIAQGYNGDSIMNSMCDVIAMSIGFWYAYRFPAWTSVVLIIVMEVGCLLWVRDNLTLNVLMLVYPSKSIMLWQSAGHVVAPVVGP